MITWFGGISEGATKGLLLASELVLLVSAIVLAAGIVGEWPESENWRKRYWYKAAKAAVLFGVIGELLGDGGIFEASARLQVLQDATIQAAKTAAANAIERAARVEQAAAWRILDRDKFLQFREVINGSPEHALALGFAVGDPESITFASQIMAAFEGTKWHITPIGHWYESQLVLGVRVLGSDEAGAALLKHALSRAAIPFTTDPVPPAPMYNTQGDIADETKLLLYVGTKPPPKF